MGLFDIFKKKPADSPGDGMNENQRYVYDTVLDKMKMGFISPGNLKEDMRDLLDDEDLGDDVSLDWVYEMIDAEHARLTDEQYSWNRPTDPDRLAKAFNELCAQKIIALHNAGYTTSDGEEDVVAVEWKLRDKGIQSEGYCFYHEQDLERAIDPNQRCLMIAFQKVDNSDEAVTLSVGQRVVDVLQKHGFAVNWNGSASQKIEVQNLDWNKLHDYNDDALYSHNRVVGIMTKNDRG